ncbi:MAG: DUF2282 domain-containing protein [Rubrivivax sp.]
MNKPDALRLLARAVAAVVPSRTMHNRNVLTAALASALTLGLLAPASAHDAPDATKGQEKCYGIAKAGQNDCANLSGTHSCAGMATLDNDPTEWRYAPRGSCKRLKGLTAAEARKRFNARKS